MNNNNWLAVYGRKINEILYQLERHSMMNTTGGLVDLKQVASYLTGAVKEIQKVQLENDELKERLQELRNSIRKESNTGNNGPTILKPGRVDQVGG